MPLAEGVEEEFDADIALKCERSWKGQARVINVPWISYQCDIYLPSAILKKQ